MERARTAGGVRDVSARLGAGSQRVIDRIGGGGVDCRRYGFGISTDRNYLFGFAVDCHHRRLTNHNPTPTHMHQCIGSTKVNTNIVTKIA